MGIKRRKFQLGIRLSASTAATTLEGEMRLDPSALTFRAYVDGAERDILTADQVQTVTNKVIDVDNNTLSNIETDNLKAGVLVTDISAASSDTELPSALAVKTALAGQNEASEITYDPSANPETSATDVQAALDDTGIASQAAADAASTAQTTADDHISDATDAHTASAITNVPAGNLAATEVQAALNELQTDVDTRALDSALTDHLNDTADAHDGSAISYDNSTSGLTAIEVQAAIDEVEARLDTTEGVATGAAADLVTHEAETITHGVTGNIVGTSDAQVVTLKDIDGGTATNTSRVTVPKATKATLDALTRKEATIVYASDEKTLYADDGTSLQPIGSGNGGGLDSFYTEDFEGQIGAADFTVGNDVTFDNGGSFNGVFTNTTSSNISGDTSIIYTQAASSLNDFVKSPVIAIDKKQQGQTVGLTFYYTYDGDSDDIKVVGYDNTGAEVMTLASNLIKASSTAQRLSVEFPVPVTSTSISWGFQTVVENSGAALVIDDVEISTNPFVYKNVLSTEHAFASYQINFWDSTGSTDDFDISLVNNSNNSLFEIIDEEGQTRIKAKTKITLTSEFGTQSNTAGSTRIFHSSKGQLSNNQNNAAITVFNPSITTVLEAGEYIYCSASNLQARIGNVTLTATAESENVIAYNSRNEANLVVEGSGNGGTLITANTTDIDFTETVDTGFGGNNWNGTQLEIPEDGIYYGSGSIRTTGDTFMEIALYIDGVKQCVIGESNAADKTHVFSFNRQFYKNQVISIRCAQTVTLDNDTTRHCISINKIGVGDLLGVPVPRTCYIKDVKASGINGGTFTSGAWRTRDLNTLSGDTEFVSLSSNQFTLQAGKYHIEAESTVREVNRNKLKLRNITDSSDDVLGISVFTKAATDDAGNTATFKGVIEITTSTTYEIQHRCEITFSGAGFGVASSFGVDEIYSQVKITKIS